MTATIFNLTKEENNMTAEQTKQEKFQAAVAKAFEKHKTKIGDSWNWDWAISESNAEDFAEAVFQECGIEF
jgi:acyl-homoserine lactone acylase PvdQ